MTKSKTDLGLRIDAFAMPTGRPDGDPAVHVTAHYGVFALHHRLTLAEAEDAHSRLGSAINALKLGASYSAGTDPRNVERLHRARMAIRRGVNAGDVRTVFDLTAPAYERLVAEVMG